MVYKDRVLQGVSVRKVAEPDPPSPLGRLEKVPSLWASRGLKAGCQPRLKRSLDLTDCTPSAQVL